MKNRILLSAMLLTISIIVGCRAPMEDVVIAKKDYNRPLAPGKYALRKITNPAEMPDFALACIDLKDLRTAVNNSLNYLGKPSSKEFFPSGQISHAQVVNSLKAFAKLLDSGLSLKELNDAITKQFDVYMSVGCDDMGTVLFTGYYTPIFDGSLTRTERFRYPLYKAPEDLVKSSSGEILGRRGANGQITKYPSRQEISSSGMLKGSELVWLSDPFEVYVAHVQGSAKIRLPDGDLITIGYAANNGHEYHGISQELVNDGKIPSDQVSLAAMIDFFKKNPSQIDMYLNKNPRFVFFRREEGQPMGSINEPVIAKRSIATDKSIFPRGALTFITTKLPKEENGVIVKRIYNGFALDQDTGGAIRAPGRCDVYMGQGDTAGKLAGQIRQEGKLYYLFLKSGI
ncbi:MAG: MltA domain-containing protein [Sedimentisphaerales bacterium]|nr:MltA domain-containing protein [Sedimentisphaerales bacterium]